MSSRREPVFMRLPQLQTTTVSAAQAAMRAVHVLEARDRRAMHLSRCFDEIQFLLGIFAFHVAGAESEFGRARGIVLGGEVQRQRNAPGVEFAPPGRLE